MKRAFLLATLLLVPLSGISQRIVPGKRVPEIRVESWLGNQSPAAAPFTYIEFFYSDGKESMASIEHLVDLRNKMGTKLRVIVVTSENRSEVAPLLEPHLSPYFVVALTDGGEFSAFGVTYIPFGVLTDGKNRALWLGNTRMLTRKTIEEAIR